jgi:putative ATPase
MNLFQQEFEEKQDQKRPLADRVRPKELKDFVGQKHIVGKGKILRKLIEQDKIASIILWGPPGSGKTTLAKIIANKTRSYFVSFSAVTSGVADVRKVIKEAKERYKFNGQETILFIDEIHRFNKAQQDAFLPHVEDGTIILIGATTENPSFEINSPLLSRAKVFHLRELTDNEVVTILKRVLKDKENGLAKYKVKIDKKALDYIAKTANGDARVALNALEAAVLSVKLDKANIRVINLKIAEDALQKKVLKYDKGANEHYDTISAFIKSLRGSDPDASLYWLARMIEAGENPRFIARRIVILASEDIGNADPQALLVATAAAQAIEYVGLPEAQLNLAQAVTYLATAPKSNASYLAINKALADVKEKRTEPVPLHLRNASTNLMKQFGFGKNYKYPHEFSGHFIKQDYLPPNVKNKKYYQPTDQGFEKEIKKRMKKIKGE